MARRMSLVEPQIIARPQAVAEDYLASAGTGTLGHFLHTVVAGNLPVAVERVAQFVYVRPEYPADSPLPASACLTDTGELIVGRREGLFRFRGLDSVGCYALEGEKQCVASFKDCLLVGSRTDAGAQRVAIYNPQAHFIEFQGRLER